MKQQLKLFIKDSLWYSLKPFFTKLFNFVLVPVYTAYLTPEDYGNLQFIIAFGMFFRMLVNLGLDSSYWKYKSGESGYSRADVTLNFTVFQLFTGISVLLIVLLIKVFLFRNSFMVFLILLLLLAQTIKIIFDNIQIIQRANHKSRMFIVAIITQSGTFLLLNILFIVILDTNYKGVIYSYLIGYTLVALIFGKILLREAKGKINMLLTREMLKYGVPIMIGNVAAYVITLSDRFFLKAYSSTLELGYYSYGYKFGDLVNALLINTFFLAWNPMRWDIYEMPDGKTVFSKFNRMLFMAIPFLGMLVMSGAIVLAALLTVDKEYLEGIRIIFFIGFSYVLFGLYYFNAMGMLFTNKTGKITQIIVISSLANLILNFILIPPFGMIGAAVATISGYMLMFIQGRIYCQKYYPIERNSLFEIVQLVIILVILVIMTWLASTISNMYILALFTLIIAFVIPLLNILFGFISREEMSLLLELVHRAQDSIRKGKKDEPQD